jgi:hypothetical protein
MNVEYKKWIMPEEIIAIRFPEHPSLVQRVSMILPLCTCAAQSQPVRARASPDQAYVTAPVLRPSRSSCSTRNNGGSIITPIKKVGRG